MKVIMLTYTDAERAAEFDAMPESDQKAWVDRHIEWFTENSDKVVGGTEMAWPQRYSMITRADGNPVFTDGPFAETKEFLGGYIEMEVESMDEAKAICSTWPNLELEGNRVVVMEAAAARE